MKVKAVMAFCAGFILALVAGIMVGGAAAEVTPTCERFVAAADRLVTVETQAIGLASESMGHVASGDIEALSRVTDEINALTPETARAAQEYGAAKAECLTRP